MTRQRKNFPKVGKHSNHTSASYRSQACAFAEGVARIAAESIIAELEGGKQPLPYKGAGTCYVEFGDGRVGKVEVDFFSGHSPHGTYTEAFADIVAENQQLGSS